MANSRERLSGAWLAAPLQKGDAAAIRAHIRHTAELFTGPKTSSPCSAAVRHVTGLFDRSVPQGAREQIACAKGCGFCCHQRIAVSAAEALAIAADIGRRANLSAAAGEAAQRLAGAPGFHTAWLRCPFLDQDNDCQIYPARPLACHAYVSTDVGRCRAGFPQKQGGVKPSAPRSFGEMQDLCRLILLSAMAGAGLANHHYELIAAVKVALDTPDAESRFLSGDNPFSSLPALAMSQEAERLIAHTVQAVFGDRHRHAAGQ